MSARVSSGRRSQLAERRRRSRRRFAIVLSVVAIVVIGLALYGLQSRDVRISSVKVFGTDLPLDQVAVRTMQGSYFWIIPKDSTFFYPEREIRANILKTYGDISGVSFFRNGPTGLSIRVIERVPIARWCPRLPETLASSTPSDPFAECYLFDDSGLLFATSSEVAVVNPFIVIADLATEERIRGQHLPHASELPAVYALARSVATLGSPTRTIALRDTEVTLTLASGTELIYTLGHETEASSALASARAQLDVASGALEYVDLRFAGKVYFKKKSQEKSASLGE